MVEIIDVDLDEPVLDQHNIDTYVTMQDVTMENDIRRFMVQMKSMENENDQIMEYHCGLFDFETESKFKVVQLHVHGCMNIYKQLIDGFKKGNGVLHLPKVLSKTYSSRTRVPYSVFPR